MRRYRKVVRVYLRSGAVVKFRVKNWDLTRGNTTGALVGYEFTSRRFANREPWTIRVEDVSAVVVSLW